MISIGTTTKGHPFLIDPTKHINLEGMSGMGKTSLLLNLFIEHIRAGGGGLFIDPHGDACDEIARMIPKGRARDFIWFDPDASHVPGLNIFDYADPKEKELGVESFQTMMKAIAGTAWGDETARVLTSAADAVVESVPHPTAVPVFRFMADDAYRERLLTASANPLLRFFQKQYDEKLRDSEQMAKFSPPINKVGKLLRPAILPVIGQPKGLDFLKIMNERKILVCRFSKGRLGDDVAQILGSLVVSMLSISALKRERQRERPQFMAVIDEVQNFVHGGRFSSLLAESRKYGITLVLATQGMHQLPFSKDVFSNCPTQIAFNVSGEDAKAIADNWRYADFNDYLAPEQITALPRYSFYCRTFAGKDPVVARVTGNPPAKRQGDQMDSAKLIRQSLIRYGKDKKAVLAKVMKFLSQS
jgi:hypothetical protein